MVIRGLEESDLANAAGELLQARKGDARKMALASVVKANTSVRATNRRTGSARTGSRLSWVVLVTSIRLFARTGIVYSVYLTLRATPLRIGTITKENSDLGDRNQRLNAVSSDNAK